MPEHYIERRLRCPRCEGKGFYVTTVLGFADVRAWQRCVACEGIGYRTYRTSLAEVAGEQIEGG